jgi:hypothetical protein
MGRRCVCSVHYGQSVWATKGVKHQSQDPEFEMEDKKSLLPHSAAEEPLRYDTDTITGWRSTTATIKNYLTRTSKVMIYNGR